METIDIEKDLALNMDYSECSVNSFSQLLTPKIMMMEDLRELGATMVVSEKLNGYRALMIVERGTVKLDYGFKTRYYEFEPNPLLSLVMDVEDVNGQIYVLDVLWNSGPKMHYDLKHRLQALCSLDAKELKIKCQSYAYLNSVEGRELITNCSEGVIVQCSNAPYYKQCAKIYKVRKESTVDLQVVMTAASKALVVIEARMHVVIPIVTIPFEVKEGDIVEYNCDTQKVVRLRIDKKTPNPESVVARAMSNARIDLIRLLKYINDVNIRVTKTLDDTPEDFSFYSKKNEAKVSLEKGKEYQRFSILSMLNHPPELYEAWKQKQKNDANCKGPVKRDDDVVELNYMGDVSSGEDADEEDS